MCLYMRARVCVCVFWTLRANMEVGALQAGSPFPNANVIDKCIPFSAYYFHTMPFPIWETLIHAQQTPIIWKKQVFTNNLFLRRTSFL